MLHSRFRFIGTALSLLLLGAGENTFAQVRPYINIGLGEAKYAQLPDFKRLTAKAQPGSIIWARSNTSAGFNSVATLTAGLQFTPYVAFQIGLSTPTRLKFQGTFQQGSTVFVNEFKYKTYQYTPLSLVLTYPLTRDASSQLPTYSLFANIALHYQHINASYSENNGDINITNQGSTHVNALLAGAGGGIRVAIPATHNQLAFQLAYHYVQGRSLSRSTTLHPSGKRMQIMDRLASQQRIIGGIHWTMK